ncbi:MAG: RsmE family RNA methyltransferase [Treponema sp.]
MNIILIKNEEITSGTFVFRRQDERFRHIKKILKCTVGDSITAGIINGKKGIATITAFSEDAITGTFFPQSDSIPLPPIQLILGIPRPIQLRRILRDVAGLGIEKIYLTGTDLGEKSYMKADIACVPEVTRLLTDGCCQAGETLIPAAAIFESLDHFFEMYADKGGECSLKAVLDVPKRLHQEDYTGSGKVSPRYYPLSLLKPQAGQPVLLAVGSERGWSNRERQLFAAQGFTVYTMGHRILRTETAAAAALAVCLAHTGCWD